MLDKIKAVMLGHAVADALGVPVEFCTREELDKSPVTEMEGYGTFPVPEGCWSDDTSMSLAALDSLKENKLDFDEIMKNFSDWFHENKYTPTGVMFDIGSTCLHAIKNFLTDENRSAVKCGLKDEYSNGNGSLMRIHPFVLYAYAKGMSLDEVLRLVDDASSMTHAHERSRLACKIYAVILLRRLDDPSIESLKIALKEARSVFNDSEEFYHYERMFSPDFDENPREKISSSGYVVDTIEAVIWCVLTTKDYKECVLKAVNLGKDTDTVAAIAGGLAAAIYGLESIPAEWLDTLKCREYIEDLCIIADCNWQLK